MGPTPAWNGDDWAAEVVLPAWHLFLEGDPSRRVEVVFLPAEDRAAPPAQAQLDALSRFVDEQSAIREIVVRAIRDHYDSVRPKYVAFAARVPDFMGDPAVAMPPEPAPEALARLHTLEALFVHRPDPGELAQVGLSFRATWEPEHGLGVLLCDREVVTLGGADKAFC